MKKKILLFCDIFLTILLMSGCGKQHEAEKHLAALSTETTIAGTEIEISASKDDGFISDGTFNEEVFKKLCKDITINGIKVEIPGKLEDWGNDYSYEKFLVNPENTEVYYCIVYDNKEIGQVIYRQEEKIIDDKIASTPYFHLIIDGIGGAGSSCGIGNVYIGDDMQKVTDAFGQPDDVNNGKEDVCYYLYKITDTKYISFNFRDDKIEKISICNE